MFAKNNVVQGGLTAAGAYSSFMIGNSMQVLKGGLEGAGAFLEGDWSQVAASGLDVAQGTANMVAGNLAIPAMGLGAAGFTAITKSMGHNYNVAPGENQGGGSTEQSTAGDMGATMPMSAGAPLSTMKVNSGYRTPERPNHDGIDYKASVGTPVYSIIDGDVTSINRQNGHVWGGSKEGWEKSGKKRYPISDLAKSMGGTSTMNQNSGGNSVTVSSGKYSFTYMHLSSIARNVSEGKRVSKGQLIGYSGDTGSTTGPHLHVTAKKNGNVVDPSKAIKEINQSGNVNKPMAGAAGAPSAEQMSALSGMQASAQSTMSSLMQSNTATQMLAAIASGDMSKMQAAAMAMVSATGAATGTSAAVQSAINAATSGTKTSSVNIELKLPDVSESEAQKFAKLVKGYLDDDTLRSNMGEY